MQREDLDEFVVNYHAEKRHERVPTWTEVDPQGRWRPYTYDESLQRDKVSRGTFWLRDHALPGGAVLPEPDMPAAQIAEDLGRE